MKRSSFDIENQSNQIESKIVVALERVSQAFRVMLWEASKECSLSPVQIQIMIFLLYHSPDKCKVSYLAREFNMTKATISDSVRILLEKALVNKMNDPHDARGHILCLTQAGKALAKKHASFAQGMESPLYLLGDTQKEIMLESLLELIGKLNETGIISVQRNCISCRFYSKKNNKHFCGLLNQSLARKDLKTDCAEHEQRL